MSDSPSTNVSRHGRWSRLCLKELRETLRDRRTLTTLILMPLLVYPILSMVFQRSLFTSVTETPKLVVGVLSEEDAKRIREQFQLAEAYRQQKLRQLRQLEQDSDEQRRDIEAELKQPEQQEAGKAESPAEPSSRSQGETAVPQLGIPGVPGRSLNVEDLVFREVADLDAAVRDELVDLAIDVAAPGVYRLTYRQASALSSRALEFVEERVRLLNEVDFRQRLAMLRQPTGIALRVLREPIEVSTNNASTLSTIVPMILILMTVTGAVYPAIDLTAGERERGTLEMLMASPVPRLRLLLAKYVAVVVVAFLTALVNLTAMMITLWATGIGKVLLGEAGIGVVRMLQILALLVLFAAFFSAVLLCLTSFARSFKEAQAYLIPLMLLSLGPGIVSLLPGLELNGLLAITPISNIVLLARDLCGGIVNPAMAGAAILSTGLYTIAALSVAARIFGTDAVLNGTGASFQTLLRSEQEPGKYRVATIGGAMFCLAVLFPVYFVVLNGLAQLTANWELSMGVRLAVSGLATSFLFGGIPWLYSRLQRLDGWTAFQIFRAPLAAFSVALLLGFSVWPIAHELVLFMQNVGFAPLSEEHLQRGAKYLAEFQTVHPFLILCTVALAPAVFEELFFRGYLFSAFRAATNPWTTILVTSLLFGVFHVVSSNALSLERLWPSTMMGLILGWLCFHSQSVLPGILLHGCHNGTLIMMGYYKEELAAAGWGLEDKEHMPPLFFAACALTLIIGLAFVYRLPVNRAAPWSSDAPSDVSRTNPL